MLFGQKQALLSCEFPKRRLSSEHSLCLDLGQQHNVANGTHWPCHWTQPTILLPIYRSQYRLCGLVVRVSGYRLLHSYASLNCITVPFLNIPIAVYCHMFISLLE